MGYYQRRYDEVHKGRESATAIPGQNFAIVLGDGVHVAMPKDPSDPYGLNETKESMSDTVERLAIQQAQHDAEMDLLRWSYDLLGITSTTDSPLAFAWRVITEARAQLATRDAEISSLAADAERFRFALRLCRVMLTQIADRADDIEISEADRLAEISSWAHGVLSDLREAPDWDESRAALRESER